MAPFNVAVYLYPSADILDFSGPVEIYSMRPASGEPIFNIKTFGHHERITTESGAMTYVPNYLFPVLEENIAEYDILVIPGAHFASSPAWHQGRRLERVSCNLFVPDLSFLRHRACCRVVLLPRITWALRC
jgi:putative intracellular protease/amidase